MSEPGTPDLSFVTPVDVPTNDKSRPELDLDSIQASLDRKTHGSSSGSASGFTNAAAKSKQAGSEAEREGGDELTKEQKQLAIRLSSLIEGANNELIPNIKMIRRHIEAMDDRPEEERNERELVKAVRPLLEHAEKILNETNGAIKGADPGQELSNRAKRNLTLHKACPEEQRLAEALKVLIEEVGGTVEWAKDKLNAFPKAKKDLGPLLDALSQPLTQIVGGVGLLLAGVLNLVGGLLEGLGLHCLLSGILRATGLDKIYKGLGVGSWLKY